MIRIVLASVSLLVVGCDDGGGEGDDARPGDAAAIDAPGFVDAGHPDAPAVDLRDRLATVAGLTVIEEGDVLPGYRFFRLVLDLPADHDHPNGQRFGLRLTLLSRDVTRPMVLATTGYSLFVPDDYLAEPTELLQANQLVVEHRYFASSRPEPADWSLLTIEQGAADDHELVKALKPIYAGPWIATGVSKGGMTAVYHSRFHQADLAGVVAYVAPLSLGAPDARYLPFFASVGDASCRERVHAYQREVLIRRGAMTALLSPYAAVRGLTYELMGYAGAIEQAAMDWEWEFWQYRGTSDCADIPTPDEDDKHLFDALDSAGGLWFSADQGIVEFQPYYVQALAELGYPASPDAHLADLLAGEKPPTPLPDGISPVFDPEVMQGVDQWVQTQGQRLLFIYGQNDPWTAGAFTLGDAEDSFELIAPGANHGASILDLEPADRETAASALERWTGASAKASRLTARSRPTRALPHPVMPSAALRGARL